MKKNNGKIKELLYIQHLDGNNLWGWVIQQKLPVNESKWEKNTFKFNKIFIINCDEESDKGYFLEINVE